MTMSDEARDSVMSRLAGLCTRLARRDASRLSLPEGGGMSVSVEWVERRTPLLREVYAVAGVEAHAELGEIVLEHKLTQRALKSAEQMDELLSQVSERVELMASPTVAYETVLLVLSGREARFGNDDDMWRLSQWAVLGYWAAIQVKEPSLGLFGDIRGDYTLALRDRFDDGMLDEFSSGEGEWVLTDVGVAKLGPGGELTPLVDPEFKVPRILKEDIMVATAEAALIAAGLR